MSDRTNNPQKASTGVLTLSLTALRMAMTRTMTNGFNSLSSPHIGAASWQYASTVGFVSDAVSFLEGPVAKGDAAAVTAGTAT